MASNQKNIDRFGARLSAQEKALLQQAANLEGRTLTDFVMTSAHERAIKVIKEHEQITLSKKDRETFINALLNPREPSAALKKALKKHNKEIRSE